MTEPISEETEPNDEDDILMPTGADPETVLWITTSGANRILEGADTEPSFARLRVAAGSAAIVGGGHGHGNGESFLRFSWGSVVIFAIFKNDDGHPQCLRFYIEREKITELSV